MSEATSTTSGGSSSDGKGDFPFEKYFWEILVLAVGSFLTYLGTAYGIFATLFPIVGAVLSIAIIRLRQAEKVRKAKALAEREVERMRGGLEQQLASIPVFRKFTADLTPGDKREVELWRGKTLELLRRAFGENSPLAHDLAALELGKIRRPLYYIYDELARAKYSADLTAAEVILKTALEVERPRTDSS